MGTKPATLTRKTSGYRIHSVPKVHPHAEGCWTVCIGKTPSRDKTKLRRKDWYFGGTEANANEEASKLAKRWRFIVEHWNQLYGSYLKAQGEPFADEPHWQPALATKSSFTPEEFADVVKDRDRVTPSEMSEAYADVTLQGVFALYKQVLATAVMEEQIGKTSQWTDEKNIRCGLAFFDAHLALLELDSEIIRKAKKKALDKLSRRTVENYFSATKRMFEWFFGSNYGIGWTRPPEWEKSFSVPNATRTNVTILTMDQLKSTLAIADDWPRLLALLGLNCGMYGADIGRLTLAEINLDQGYVFWDREKQPSNPFQVRHNFWPETLRLVKKFIQPQRTTQRFFDDFRGHKPTQVDCSTLAFVDANGNALYRVRPSGKAYSKIDKAWQKLNAKLKNAGKSTVEFHVLRKATNQQLKTLLRNKVGDDERTGTFAIAISEICKEFLGEKTDELERLYATMGVEGFGRMNKYLSEVGDVFRAAKVFAWSR
jgi:integrase